MQMEEQKNMGKDNWWETTELHGESRIVSHLHNSSNGHPHVVQHGGLLGGKVDS